MFALDLYLRLGLFKAAQREQRIVVMTECCFVREGFALLRRGRRNILAKKKKVEEKFQICWVNTDLPDILYVYDC